MALFHGKEILKGVSKDPSKLLFGVDPLGSKVGSLVTGRDSDSLINAIGGPTSKQFSKAKAEGIDTGPSKVADDIAKVAVAYFTGGAAAGHFGSGASAVSGSSSAVSSPLASAPAGESLAPILGSMTVNAPSLALPQIGVGATVGAASTSSGQNKVKKIKDEIDKYNFNTQGEERTPASVVRPKKSSYNDLRNRFIENFGGNTNLSTILDILDERRKSVQKPN